MASCYGTDHFPISPLIGVLFWGNEKSCEQKTQPHYKHFYYQSNQ